MVIIYYKISNTYKNTLQYTLITFFKIIYYNIL